MTPQRRDRAKLDGHYAATYHKLLGNPWSAVRRGYHGLPTDTEFTRLPQLTKSNA